MRETGQNRTGTAASVSSVAPSLPLTRSVFLFSISLIPCSVFLYRGAAWSQKTVVAKRLESQLGGLNGEIARPSKRRKGM